MADEKPSIDERLEAIAQSLELLSVNVHAMQDESKKAAERLERLDERERRGRRALLAGVEAYLRELGNANGAEE